MLKIAEIQMQYVYYNIVSVVIDLSERTLVRSLAWPVIIKT